MALSLETLLLAKQLGGSSGGGGEGGTTNYNQLTNKPSINGVTLSGNKSLSDLGAMSAEDGVSSETITTIWAGTQAEYDLIATKDIRTLYFIKEE